MRLFQESQYFFLKLAAAFARNDLNFPDLFCDGVIKSPLQSLIYRAAIIIYIMEINFYPGQKPWIKINEDSKL